MKLWRVLACSLLLVSLVWGQAPMMAQAPMQDPGAEPYAQHEFGMMGAPSEGAPPPPEGGMGGMGGAPPADGPQVHIVSSLDPGAAVKYVTTDQYGLTGEQGAQISEAVAEAQKRLQAKLSEIEHEQMWVERVQEIIRDYKIKIENVKAHIVKHRKEAEALQKQANKEARARIRGALEQKLRKINSDLEELHQQSEMMHKQLTTLKANKVDLSQSMRSITSELNKLRSRY